MVKIKDIPVLERPIERLINSGVDNLTNEELLAILLKTGSKKMSSKELSIYILSKINGIHGLKSITFNNLIKIDGIGNVKAATILAALELSKRVDSNLNTIYNKKINNAELVFEYFKNIMKDKMQECFYCLYLNSNKKVVESKLLFIGTLNYSMIHPREVFKEAYLVGAVSIICVHNHPTGEILPSNMDIKMTSELVNIGNMLGIKIDDHIIIGRDKYYSFYENNNI